jgi:hypothetical protein
MKMPELPLRAIEGWDADDLYDFARAYGELVREECAKTAEAQGPVLVEWWKVDAANAACQECAAAIRSGA